MSTILKRKQEKKNWFTQKLQFKRKHKTH